MFERLEKYQAELSKAKEKRAEWDAKVKELEKKCETEEKNGIHEMMKAANLTPAELARVIAFSKGNAPMSEDLGKITKAEDTEDED